MTGIGIGLGLGLGGGPGLGDILAGLASRSQIAGRDGVIACTRATPRRCVFTGAVLPNNTACYGTFDIPGMGPMRFYLAEPISTNREVYSDMRASDWLGSGSVKSTNGAYARFTETLTDTSHRVTASSAITPTGATTYTFSFIVGPETTAPYVTATVGTAWNATRIVATANLATGAIGGGLAGGVFPLADGSKLVSFTFTTVAAPTGNNIPIGMSITGAETYMGVGNFIDVKDVMLEASPIPGARIDTAGSSVTHNADEVDWTPATPVGSDMALWGIYIPLGWSAAANAGMPGGVIPRMFAANSDTLRYFTQSNFVYNRTDASAANLTSSSGTLEARDHAKGSAFSATTFGPYLNAYHGSQAAAGSPAGVTPYPNAATIRLGNRTGSMDRALRSVVCMGLAPNITAVERAALDTISKTLANKFIL